MSVEPGFKRNGSSAAATTEAARNEKRQLPARGSGSGRDGDGEVGAEEEAEAEAAQQFHQGHSYSHSQAQLLQPLSILHRRVLFTVCLQIKLRIKAETERENARE